MEIKQLIEHSGLKPTSSNAPSKTKLLKPAEQKTNDTASSSQAFDLPDFPDNFTYGFKKNYNYRQLGRSKEEVDREIVRRIVAIYANFLTENGGLCCPSKCLRKMMLAKFCSKRLRR